MLCHVFRDSGTSCSRFWLTLSSDGIISLRPSFNAPPVRELRVYSDTPLSVDDGEADATPSLTIGPLRLWGQEKALGKYDIQRWRSALQLVQEQQPKAEEAPEEAEDELFNEEAHTPTRRDSFSRLSLFSPWASRPLLPGWSAKQKQKPAHEISPAAADPSSQHDPAYLARLDGVLGALC